MYLSFSFQILSSRVVLYLVRLRNNPLGAEISALTFLALVELIVVSCTFCHVCIKAFRKLKRKHIKNIRLSMEMSITILEQINFFK